MVIFEVKTNVLVPGCYCFIALFKEVPGELYSRC
ncbi:MAG: hypothetical protein A4E54_01880 [Pelotomaculum sp. PtaB.Bin117]|nr:MAG: hypothetical protein A4E54_01880 [Pelotomaculum sp. PtaB.Bin117]OPY61982.1 MAG: hypothetical protein A4E56_01694 [Pelotomaculum sp. PtaU1.Bin065]